MKKKKISLAFIVLCIVFASAVFVSAEYNSRKYAENVLRFHVIANSDTPKDQQLKLKVRNRVIKELDSMFSKDGDMMWQCINCGHLVVGKKAPNVCPVCSHPQSYFQIRAENY